jgi:hypothetical protein
MRGRGNRKGPNPLTRSYESNGPDVKIRGSAQQIAEKYTALARDAQGAGDRVIAENYLQHAEHYNRIIAAAQGQLQAQSPRDNRDEYDDDDGDMPPNPVAERPKVDGSGPQPVINGTPAEIALGEQAAAPENAMPERSGEPEQKAPRRPRRPRKEVRASGPNGAGDGPAGNGDAESAGNEGDPRLAAASG